MRLTIELVPAGSWGQNLRTILSKQGWDTVRRKCYREAGYVCEICGGKGNRHPVECHERWEYDDKTKTQTLVGFWALCPMCHRVKHIGRTLSVGLGDSAIKHLAKVNGISIKEAWDYVDASMVVWQDRNRYTWTVDISYAGRYIREAEGS